MNDLKKLIKDNLLRVDGKVKNRSELINAEITRLIFERTAYLDTKLFTERVYHILNDLYARPKCPTCGIELTRFVSKYSTYCATCGLKQTGGDKSIQQCINSKKQAKINFFNELNKMQNEATIKLTKNDLLLEFERQMNNRNYVNILPTPYFIDIAKAILFYTSNQMPLNFPIKNLNKEVKMAQRIYILKNDIQEIPKCKCGMNKTFINGARGYFETCGSSKCRCELGGGNRVINTGNILENSHNTITFLETYKGEHQHIKLLCNICKNEFTYNFPNGRWVNNENSICPYCTVGGSRPEHSIFTFIRDLKLQCIKHNRKFIRPYELDIVVPEAKLAIEFNGVYWHSDDTKDKYYHRIKTDKCLEQGIQLIHIFEDEWRYKKDIVKSCLLAKLGKLSNKIYARKCEVREVSSKDKDVFLLNNHLQGTDKSKIRLGLYFENELVSIMTFGRRQISHTANFELLRFCSKLNTSVVGAAQKLFSHFIKNYEFEEIKTYADRRWSNGELYKTLGFTMTHISPVNYWYIEGQNRVHRVNFQKHKLKDKLEKFDPMLTEWENMQNNGYRRIWDCGNYVYSFKKE